MSAKHERGRPTGDGSERREGADFERRRYFGRLLRRLRETYSERVSERIPASARPLVRTRITASALVECMQKEGCQISQAAFSDIENGINVPRDADVFLSAITACLQLTD